MIDQDKIEKFKVIYSSYNEVNNLDRYEDNKAERGLQALAFITLSGVTIFAASLYILTTLYKNQALLFTSYALFVIFIALISAGTMCILYAIKPSFNIPKNWDGDAPKSIFFFMHISAMEQDAWIKFLLNINTDDLLDKAIKDLSYETHLIAVKIGKKVKWSKNGFKLYLTSILFMVSMAIIMVVLAALTA